MSRHLSGSAGLGWRFVCCFCCSHIVTGHQPSCPLLPPGEWCDGNLHPEMGACVCVTAVPVRLPRRPVPPPGATRCLPFCCAVRLPRHILGTRTSQRSGCLCLPSGAWCPPQTLSPADFPAFLSAPHKRLSPFLEAVSPCCHRHVWVATLGLYELTPQAY